MREGDKVVCIIDGICLEAEDHLTHIEKKFIEKKFVENNKTYTIGLFGVRIFSNGEYLHVKELERWSPSKFFITLSEFRENRINKILE